MIRLVLFAIMKIPPYDLVTTYPNGSFEVVGSSKIITEWLMQKLKAS